MKVEVSNANLQGNLKFLKQEMLQHIPKHQLAKDLVSFFDTPSNTKWLQHFQRDFAYVFIGADLRITLGEDKPLVLKLDTPKEIALLPSQLKRTISIKLLKLFGSEE